MISGLRSFSILGYVIYVLIFFFLEKKTGIPFISNRTILVILTIIWVVFIAILAVVEYKRNKEEDDL
ncbi:hypothetical protein FACS1894130_01650 [Spirochaetia bacterium]|nr:hypothetical protein FACS1894130_01650 [Spirochaetia bacterium]